MNLFISNFLLQVTDETCQILQHFGYQFEQRGLVAVKGKGQLMTYYLLGKAGKITPPTAPVSPVAGVSAMETLTEEDESHDSPTSKSEEKTVIECNADDTKSEEEDVFVTEVEVVAGQQEENCADARDSTENTLLLGS